MAVASSWRDLQWAPIRGNLITNPEYTLKLYLDLIDRFGGLFTEESRKKLNSEIERLTDELIEFNNKLGDK